MRNRGNLITISPDVPPCSRRRFLLGTAATAAGVSVTACAPKSKVEKADVAGIPVGGGVVIGNYVVTQLEEGKFAAFSSSCLHQNGRISEVSNGVMTCPNHNLQFDTATGEVVVGPSRKSVGQAPPPAEGTELIVGQKQVLEVDQWSVGSRPREPTLAGASWNCSGRRLVGAANP